MQSLYAYFIYNDCVKSSEKKLLTSLKEVSDLYFVIYSLLIQLIKYADSFFEDSKKKHLPTKEDLNPRKRFINNLVIKNILKNKKLNEKCDNFKYIWKNNDHRVIDKLFSSIYKSDHYKKYVSNEDLSVNIDKRFFSNLLNQYILNNKLVVHILEEKSIFWVDDLPFIAAIIIGEIKSNDHINFKNIFKDDADEKFAIQLLIDTINNTSIYDEIIEKHSENWDLDRIAFMDKLFLKMAFTELLYMNSLPIKVTLNEYIEISKYYSTSKSKIFVNGILDKVVKFFTENGSINKL
tara:strand:+ start:2146 stop:3024 length:879 start_codon:yes stop_codon:yes gene_type:complete